MPCTVIVGAFWGDEGKGKIISYLALKDKLDFCVRTGSVNAAHTVYMDGKKFALHMVPAGFVYPQCKLRIAAGANVHVGQFFKEVELTGTQSRVGVDQNASIIEQKHSDQDKASAVNKGIGTTGWGVGPAIEERVRRTAKLAKDVPELKPYVMDTIGELNDGLDAGKSVLLEGTQGFMLSLFLGGGYQPSLEQYKRKVLVLKSHCEKTGRPFSEVGLSCWPAGQILLGEDQRELEERVDRVKPKDVSRKEYAKYAFIGNAADFLKTLEPYRELGATHFMLAFADLPDAASLRAFAKAANL